MHEEENRRQRVARQSNDDLRVLLPILLLAFFNNLAALASRVFYLFLGPLLEDILEVRRVLGEVFRAAVELKLGYLEADVGWVAVLLVLLGLVGILLLCVSSLILTHYFL